MAYISNQTVLKVPDFEDFSNIHEIDRAINFIRKTKEYLTEEIRTLVDEKDRIIQQTIDKFPTKEDFIKFKNRHVNEAISRTVKREDVYSAQIKINNNQLIRKSEPIFNTPENLFGRAHFYAPQKKIATLLIDTYWFNLIVLWLMWAVLYIILQNNSLLKFYTFFNKLKTKSVIL
ncbi:MAG: hypothetical protein HC831_09620 [Chloroflexia bacterium]|nr:hypothetical protein [Chloroflexia bacterium]